MVKFNFKKLENQPNVGSLSISDDGITLAEIINSNDFNYCMIYLDQSKDIRFNITKIKNLWKINLFNLRSHWDCDKIIDSSKFLTPKKLEQKVNLLIDKHRVYSLFK